MFAPRPSRLGTLLSMALAVLLGPAPAGFAQATKTVAPQAKAKAKAKPAAAKDPIDLNSATSEELLRAFLAASLFLQATEQPGFMAIGEPPEGLVPVWTTEAELARSLGAAAWFSTNGADLLDLLPPGYDLLLDPDGDSALRLRPSALRPEQALTVVWE